MQPDLAAQSQAPSAGDPTCRVAGESKRLPCDLCGHPMEPEHAHYKCPNCHYILPCCGW